MRGGFSILIVAREGEVPEDVGGMIAMTGQSGENFDGIRDGRFSTIAIIHLSSLGPENW